MLCFSDSTNEKNSELNPASDNAQPEGSEVEIKGDTKFVYESTLCAINKIKKNALDVFSYVSFFCIIRNK